jgi:hypothetical protein
MPEPVLQRAQQELLDWHGRGMSIMEMSHRSADFGAVMTKTESDLRSLLAIPANYRVLFLQGGALGQNAAVPLNLLPAGGVADYVDTGHWSQKSIAEARKYGRVNVAASSDDAQYTYIPPQPGWRLSRDASYVHVTTNETIGGVEYSWVPDTGNVPLVADASSHILSRPLDVAKFGVIYAGAQKNAGPAGLTLVIVRDDLPGRARRECPSVLDYAVQAAAASMFNTPSTFAIYLAGRARGHRAREHREGDGAVRADRRQRLLPQSGPACGSFADERALFPARRAAERAVPHRRGRPRPDAAQGPSRGRRHARVDLQRDADRRRAGADRLDARVRAGTWLTSRPPATTRARARCACIVTQSTH